MLILRRISATLLVRGMSAVASLGLAALVTTVYSLAVFGAFSFALMTVKMVAAIALFSIHSVLLKLLLRGELGQDRRARPAVVRECGGMATLFSLMAMVVVIAVALGAMELGASGDFWLSLALTAPIIPLQNITNVQAVVLRAERRDATSQVLLIGLPTILPPLVVGAGALAGQTPRFLPEVAATGALLVAALAGVVLSRTAPFLHLSAGARALLGRRHRIVRHAWAPHLANMMNYLSDWYGSMLLAATQSMEMTGALRIIQQFGAMFQLMITSVENPLSTEIGRAHRNRDYPAARRFLRHSQLLLGGAGWALALMAALLSGPILSAFKADLPQVQLALIVFLAFQAGRTLTGASGSALFLMDATSLLVRAATISLVLAAVLQSALVPFLGIVGAAAGLGAGMMARAVITYLFVQRELSRRTPA